MKPESKFNLPILGAFAFFLIITVITAGYLFSNNQLEKSKREAEEKLEAVGHLKQAQLSQWLKERMGDSRVIKENYRNSRRFYDFLINPDGKTQNELIQWMNSRLSNYGYENIFYFDPDRKLRLKTGGDEEDSFEQEFYSLLDKSDSTNKVVFSGLYKTSGIGSDVDFIVPLSSQPGGVTTAGFIVLRSDPKSFLFPLLTKKVLFNTTLETALVEIGSEEKRVFIPLKKGENRITLAGSFIDYNDFVLGSDTVIEAVDYRGNTVLASLNSVSGSSWFLITKVDRAEVYAPVKKQRLLIMVIAGLIVIGASVGAGLIWHNRQAKLYKRLYREELEKEALSEQLDVLLRQANDIIVLGDRYGKILEVNEKAEKYYGYSREELIGMDVEILRAPGYKRGPAEIFFKELDQSGGRVYETYHIRKDKTIFPVEASARVIRKNGDFFVQSIIRDISDRKKAEQHQNRLNRLYDISGAVNKVILHQSEMRAILEGICGVIVEKGNYLMCWAGIIEGERILPVAYAGKEDGYLSKKPFTIDKSEYGEGPAGRAAKTNRVHFSNDIAADLLMRPWRDAALDRGYHSLAAVPLVHDDHVLGVLTVKSETKNHFDEFELQLLKNIGYDAAYALQKVLIVAHDIAEMKKADNKIKELNADLEKKIKVRTHDLETVNKELEAFAYSVSHDLRAPLRSIDGFSQALVEDYKDKLDDTGLNYLSRVRAASQRMGKLIDDILSLSRITRRELGIADVDLTDLAKSIAEDLKKISPERKVEFMIQEGLCARGDKVLFQSALNNLLENAYKFTSKMDNARIEFGCRKEDEKYIYYVKDNGAGFDMKYAEKLFSPFQRLHHADEYPGTGIGLANVQKVIRRHGGEIWVEAEKDKGAAFYFTLNEKNMRA